MLIEEIFDEKQKIEIATGILKSLLDWFGLPEYTQEYIDKGSKFGFILIKENLALNCLH